MININKHLLFFSGLVSTASILIYLIAQTLLPLLNHAVYYCQSIITTYISPIPYFLSVLPLVILLVLIIFPLGKLTLLTIQVLIQRRNLNNNKIFGKRIHDILIRTELEQKTVIIKSKKPFAYCLGITNPKIYISSSMINKLNKKEFEAVLRHEQYHLKNYDIFTMITASFAYSLLPFFPLLGDYIKKYRIEREIEADTFSINAIGSSYPLISALKKLLAYSTIKQLQLAAIADHDTLEPRIYNLLNKSYKRKQYRKKHLIISLFSAFLISAIIVSPIYAEEIHHVEHDVVMVCTDGACMNSCTNEENLNALPQNQSRNKEIIDNASHPYRATQR